MAEIEIIMPKMGESIMEATILGWLKKEGDAIEQDESLLEVATDKVDTEVPSTHGGIIKKILAEEGAVVEVGKPIALITTDSVVENGEPMPEPTPNGAQEEVLVDTEGVEMTTTEVKSVGNRFYSPLVKNIAQKENIGQSELDSISGTGKDGRVTKYDILNYLKVRTDSPAPAIEKATEPVPAPEKRTSSVQPVIDGSDEIIEMDRMRKMIADRMVESKHVAPHVTSFVEADVTRIVNWRNKNKETFKQREGEPLTFTPIFIEAIVSAIKDFPNINVQVDGTRIIKKRDINIGLAVALPSGNLIVPVIKRADQLSLVGLTKAVNDLANRARNNQLKPDDLSGGTFSVSNVGSFGNVMGTPIILQPQVAIMATGAIQKKPSVIETPEGDAIGIRHKMFLSHSYDHRVVDGALGGMVVRRVADYLENFDVNRSI